MKKLQVIFPAAVWFACSFSLGASEDSLKVFLNVSSENGALRGCMVSVQQGEAVLTRLSTDNEGNAVIPIDKKTAKKPIAITVSLIGYYNRKLDDLKVVDGEELNVVMDPLTDPDVVSVVEGVLDGKDVAVVMKDYTRQGEESEGEENDETPQEPEREKSKKEKQPKEKKAKSAEGKEKKQKEPNPPKEKKEKKK